MGLIEGLDNTGISRVKAKKNRTGDLKWRLDKAARVARGAPEVMVKISGFGKGAAHVKAHLDYVSRHGKVELEDDNGIILNGRDEIKEYFDEWGSTIKAGDIGHKSRRDTVHIVLSMPPGTDPDALKNAVREFARTTFGNNHEYLFGLHTDEKHPHCHLTVKMQGLDGTRLNPRKADLQAWRDVFAEKLIEQGINAVATPRAARGKVRKSVKTVITHIYSGDKTHEPRVPWVFEARAKAVVNDVIEEVRTGIKKFDRVSMPWLDAIERQRSTIRAAWLSVAVSLENQNGRRFVNERPDYSAIDPAVARRQQRAAYLYQSGFNETGRIRAAGAESRMRDLSGLPLVHDQRTIDMLLPQDARHGMGRQPQPDTAMRWPGASLGRHVIDLEPSALAHEIREFVSKMPASHTERDELKRAAAARQVGRATERPEASRNLGRDDRDLSM